MSIAVVAGDAGADGDAFSFSKAYGMTAYRIGYAVGPARFIDHLHSILRFSIQACSAVGQRAAHAVLTGDMEPWLRESTANLERKRDYLVDRLNRIPGIRCNTPRGVYFVFPDIRGLGLGSVRAGRARPSRRPRRRGAGLAVRPDGRRAICASASAPAWSNIEEGMNRFERALGELPAPRPA